MHLCASVCLCFLTDLGAPLLQVDESVESFLYKLFDREDNKVTQMREHHTSDGVKFVLTAPAKVWDDVEREKGGLLEYFKLSGSINTSKTTQCLIL